MFVPFHADGVISQFEGYEDLEELDWDGLRARHGNIQRLDRILRAEGDDPNRYKAAKQADTLMLFYLFPDAELKRIFAQLGYDLSPDVVRRTIEYYDRRTSHGSTLSFIVHAGVLAGIDPESSWERFLVALHSDVDDIQGGTTAEGIHAGVMAGTLDLVQRIYLGAEVRDGVVFFEPRLRERLDGLSLLMQFRGTPLRVGIDGSELTVEVLHGGVQPARSGSASGTTSASSPRASGPPSPSRQLRVAPHAGRHWIDPIREPDWDQPHQEESNVAPTLLEELNEMHAFYVAAINVALTEDDLTRAGSCPGLRPRRHRAGGRAREQDPPAADPSAAAPRAGPAPPGQPDEPVARGLRLSPTSGSAAAP